MNSNSIRSMKSNTGRSKVKLRKTYNFIKSILKKYEVKHRKKYELKLNKKYKVKHRKKW